MSTIKIPTIFSICSADLSFQDGVFEQLKVDSKLDTIYLRRPEFNFSGNKFLCFGEGYHETLSALNAAQFSHKPVSIANGFLSEFFMQVSRLDLEQKEMAVGPHFSIFKKMLLSQVKICHMFLRVKSGENSRRTSLLELSGLRDSRHTNERWLCFDGTDPKKASEWVLRHVADALVV